MSAGSTAEGVALAASTAWFRQSEGLTTPPTVMGTVLNASPSKRTATAAGCVVSAVWQARVSKVAAALTKPWSQPRTAAPVKLRSGATRLTPPINAPPGSTRARGVL
ncbi:MAG: hypothetical protein BGO36_03625 [Burkholderiales bacterium 68-10]|nr:MAG: hypothetical protein BGO36_03625 [Burkholderiales bacterium 68-10]